MNNVAHKAPVTAFSSIEDGGWQVAALTDGIKGGIGWSSKAFASFPDHNLYPEWVAIDLGRYHRIDRIDLYPRGDGANAGQGFPQDFTLALCVEGEPWQTVAALKDCPLPKSGEVQSFPIPPRVARYVRIQATRLRSFDGKFHFQMSEVEVFGVPVEAPAFAATPLPPSQPPSVTDLRCEHRVDPLGVDTPAPLLRWSLAGTRRGLAQSAYRVLIASCPGLLAREIGDVWDSGQVGSDESQAIVHPGTGLRSGQECFWAVRVWDEERQPTVWSSTARFVMGRLASKDWRGRWIGPSIDPAHAAVWLRREFTVSRPVRRATLFCSGLGWSEISINGRPVSDWVLTPGHTCYHLRTPYVVHDVTAHFATAGAKVIGVVLGDGWYALEKDPWAHKFEQLPYVDKPKLLLDIELEFADGSTQVLHSDGSWKWSFGTIAKNWVALEHIDLRKSMPGWDQPGFADSAWQPVALVKGPAGKLVCQKEPPTRVIQTIRPQTLTHDPKSKSYQYDFGREFQGWVQFRTSGPAGTEIEIFVHPPKHEAQGYNHGYSNRFILAGKGVEQYVPRFNYNAISSIEIKGTPQPPALEDLVGCQVNADLQTAGAFRCSDDTLNWLHDTVIRMFMNYITGIPNDPTREKKGWTQDILGEFHSAAYLFDAQRLFERWQTDIVDGQAPDGNCPNVTPGPYFDEYNSTWWGGMVVWGPWQWYQVYGDRRILIDSYPAMKKYVDFLTKAGTDHMQDWGLADWLAFEGSNRMLVNTPAYYLYTNIVSQVAAMLGQHEDSKTYADLAQTIKRTFNMKFLYTQTGVYNLPNAKPFHCYKGGNDSESKGDPDVKHHRIWWQPGEPVCTQGAQTLALVSGLVPAEVRKNAEESLLKEIAAHDGYLSTGFISSMYLLDILSDLAPQVGQTMVEKRHAPSWYAMTVGTDNAVLKETWSGGTAMMPNLGCSVAFWNFYSLGGIRPDPRAPGFKKIIIKPNMAGNLHWVECHYDSVHGRIVSNWQRRGRQFTMDVTIPANTSATVHVPVDCADGILENGKPLKQSVGIRLLRTEKVRIVLACESGVYRFTGNLSDQSDSRQ